MELIKNVDFKLLAGNRNVPCVSLYLPRQRGKEEADRIHWKNLLREAEEALAARGMRGSEIKELLQPAFRFVESPDFSPRQGDGIAYFLAPGVSVSYRLPVPVKPRAVVAGRFHVKPLLPSIHHEVRFFVLAFSTNKVRLFECSATRARELQAPHMPHSLAEALRFDDRDEPLTFHTRPAPGGKGRWAAIFSGQGVGIDDVKSDLLRYFQRIDKGLHELVRDEQAPLVLASVDYLWPIYREANTYAHLLEKGVPGNPDRMSAEELRAQAWLLVEPHANEATDKAQRFYGRLTGTGRTSDDLAEIVRAAHEGQIETLFVALDKDQWGMFDPAGGMVAVHERAQPGDEDLLNLAVTETIRHRGTVYAVAAEKVPGNSPAAAIYRGHDSPRTNNPQYSPAREGGKKDETAPANCYS
jgi:hypothetical protein